MKFIDNWGLNKNMKKTNLKWRLGKLPDVTEVAHLLTKDVITKEEAREILFSLETEEERNKKSLQDEIKFLRELVAKLSTNRSVIVETIREVEKPWKRYDWYQPYYLYANNSVSTGLTYTNGTVGSTPTTLSGSGTSIPAMLNASSISNTYTDTSGDFTNIKTF